MIRLHLGKAGTIAGLALGLWAFAGTAVAQAPLAGAGCGPNGCGGPAQGPAGKGPCSTCGQRMYPVFDNRYIRQYCKPTINPGSCFGHYKTQWTPWGGACPNWGGDGAVVDASVQNPLDRIPANKPDMIPPIGSSPKEALPNPKPVPTPDPTAPPAKDPPKVQPTIPPVVPAPKIGTDPGIVLPPIPELNK